MGAAGAYEELLNNQARARGFLEGATSTEVDQMVDALVRQEHLDSFDLIMLGVISSDQPTLSDKTQLLLAGLLERHRHVGTLLVARPDVTEAVLVLLAERTLVLRILPKPDLVVGALAHPRLPTWMMAVAYRMELIACMNPVTDLYAAELLRNPALPVTARAVLTVQAVNRHQNPWTSPDPTWMHKACGWYEPDQDDKPLGLNETVSRQIEEGYPELLDLPLEFLLSVLETQPTVVPGWDETPSTHDVWERRLAEKYRSWRS